MMKWRNRRGFTLIEVIVAITIMGMILPLVGTALYQFIKVPPEQTDELTVINEVRQVAEWIVEDGTQATYYMAGEFWQYTTEGKLELVAGYTLEDDGTLTRYTDPYDPTLGVNIAQHITDLDFKLQPTYLKVYIESTIDGIGGQTMDSGTVFVFPKSYPEAYTPLSYAIFCGGDGIKITGGSKTIEGNVYSGGTVDVQGNNNTINGTLDAPELTGNINNNNIPEPEDDWAEQGFPPIWVPQQFEPDWYTGPYYNDTNYFSLYGNALSGDLAPGVYHSDSAVTIGAGTTGHVTIIAPTIKVTGNEVNLTTFHGGMLLWATEGDIFGAPGQMAIEITSNDSYFEGFIYAPEGTVSISSQGGTVINGSIIAQGVVISGNLWLISH